MEWSFKLLDDMSRPAAKMLSSLQSLDKKIAGCDAQLRRFDIAKKRSALGTFTDPIKKETAALELNRMELLHQKAAIDEAHGSWSRFAGGLGIIGGIGAGLAVGASALAYEGAKFAVNTLAARQSTLATFEVMLKGNRAAAEDLFAQAARFGKETPFETSIVIAGFERLLNVGFAADQVLPAFKALGDVAASRGDFGGERIMELAEAFGAMKNQGRLGGEVLHRMALAGVPLSVVYEKLGRTVLKGVEDTERLTKAGHALVESGKVDADKGGYYIVDAIKDRLGGNELGGMIKRQSRTISGLLSTLKSVPEDLFLSMDTDKVLPNFTGALTALTDEMDASAVSGGRLGGIAGDLVHEFDNLFVRWSGDTGAKNLRDDIQGVLDVAEPAIRDLKDLGKTLVWLAGLNPISLGRKAAAYINNANAIDLLNATAEYAPGDQADAAAKIEARAMEELRRDEAYQLIGEQTGDIPAMASGGIVRRPTLALIGEAGPEAVVPLGRGGSAGSARYSVTVHVHAEGLADREAGEAIAARVEAILPSALASAFERIALEAGAA